MADERDESQQTEQPTPKRLEQARESGDAVRSQEVSTFVMLAGGTLAIMLFGRSTALAIGSLLTVFIGQPDRLAVDGAGLAALLRGTLVHLALALAPVAGVVMAAAVAGSVLQNRPALSSERLAPDFARLSPVAGFKRMFGSDGWLNLLKGLLKIAIVGMAIWTQIWPQRGILESLLTRAPVSAVADMDHLLLRVLAAALSALLVIAGLDYVFQYRAFIRRNRMSKQEVKEEFRQNEGDPAIKAKIRQLRQERARKRMMARVPEATVVVMNPTHFAVALQYEAGRTAAPVCVAKGVDALALRIRAVAEEHGVPVVENPPLARALHATVEIDEPVPPEQYKAVAQVIGYVLRLSGKLRSG